MKNLIPFLCFLGLLCSSNLLAQPKTYFHPNGTKRSEGEFQAGKKSGVWMEWDSLGNVVSSISYVDGKRNGPFTMWVTERQTLSKFGVGRQTGSRQLMKNKGSYLNDRLGGEFKAWYPNDTLSIHCHFRNGAKDRFWRFQQNNGQLTLEEHYLNGVLHGVRNSYSDKGELLEFILYEEGRKIVSTNYEWYPNGNPKREEGAWYDRENGAKYPDGPIKEYFEDGQLSFVNTYDKGVIHGVWKGFYPNGKLKYKATYHQGKLLLWEDFDEAGNLVPKK